MNCDNCPFDYDCGHTPDECAISNALDDFLELNVDGLHPDNVEFVTPCSSSITVGELRKLCENETS